MDIPTPRTIRNKPLIRTQLTVYNTPPDISTQVRLDDFHLVVPYTVHPYLPALTGGDKQLAIAGELPTVHVLVEPGDYPEVGG